MKKSLLIASLALILGGCVSTPPPAPVTRTIIVPADTQTVYVVREGTPVYYYPPVRWSIGIGFGGGRGHYHGPWRR